MELKDIVPWGRSFDEYRRMFLLSDSDLSGRILGCGDGPASFNAEAKSRGHDVISCDPIYAYTVEQIRQRVEESYESVVSQVRRNPEWYVWDVVRDPDDLGRRRLAAMEGFLDDFEKGKREGRYVTAALPTLPFADGQFAFAVVSHLLFLYSAHLDEAAHIASIFELLRVAREVRIFPVITLDRRWSPHIEPVRSSLEAAGFTIEIVPALYEFQRAPDRTGNRMMRVFRRTE